MSIFPVKFWDWMPSEIWNAFISKDSMKWNLQSECYTLISL